MTTQPKKAPRNRTLELTESDRERLSGELLQREQFQQDHVPCGVICGDSEIWTATLPRSCVDLLFLDPPYNLTRSFGKQTFRKVPTDRYTEWLDQVVTRFLPLLKPTATVYLCGDWVTSHSIFTVAQKHFRVRNRITWEREKGRGARHNWKNNCEDIWFCTVSDDYCFNVDDVKHRRPVIAPYRNVDRTPKDWNESKGGNFRDTFPSNLWTDISIPFWSMPENTRHPAQKSEKLLAKLILASSRPGERVFDPFAGSGTSCVVARKLGRKYLGIEMDEEFAMLALRRLEMASDEPSIQGYRDGVFWPRNSQQKKKRDDTI